MEAVTLRRMQQEDVAIAAHWVAVVPLWQRYGLTAPATQQQLEAAMRRDDLLVVADVDTLAHTVPGHLPIRACGFAWCLWEGGFGRSAYLRLLGVRPKYAGLGIGSALLHEVERLVVGSSTDLFLMVSDFNTAAQRFYQRHGYTQIGAVPGYVLPDVTELIFRKQLRQFTKDSSSDKE